MLGKVFGYAAVVRCEQRIDQDTAAKCAEGLIQIANKKSFLRELAANVLLDMTGDLKHKLAYMSLGNVKHMLQLFIQQLI